MSRKDVIRAYTLPALVAGAEVPMDLGTDFESKPVGIVFEDNIGLILSWTGASPVGEIFVAVTNQKDEPGVTQEFADLDFGAPITISGATGKHIVNINQAPFEAFKVRYERSSGTGSLKVYVQAKSV